VIRPEGLFAVRQLNHLVRLATGMAGGKRSVARRMPVLGNDHLLELLGETVDQQDDLVTLGHGQLAAGSEVVLDVDDQ